VIWVFAIIGLLTSASALYRLVTAVREENRSWPAEAVVLLLVVAAWIAQHTSTIGWVALLGALGIEARGWIAIRPRGERSPLLKPPLTDLGDPPPDAEPSNAALPAEQSPPESLPPECAGAEGQEDEAKETTESVTDPADLEERAVEAEDGGDHGTEPSLVEEDTADAEPDEVDDSGPAADTVIEETASRLALPIDFTTVVLLNSAWEAAGEVFLASLRRTGQRDAELLTMVPDDQGPGPAKERIMIRTGPMTLQLAGVPRPVGQDQIACAAAQSWDWPEASSSVAGHRAHVLLTTHSPAETPGVDIVHLHRRAHAALGEFSQVLAALWPEAGRLVPPAASLGSTAQSPSAGAGQLEEGGPAIAGCCVNFRVLPLEEPEGGCFVADSLGLHAFGMPDIEIVTEGEPDESVSAVVYELAERFLAAGCSIEEGDEFSLDGKTNWRAERTQARFPPQRGVLQLTRLPS
jgi:hypothetical protein